MFAMNNNISFSFGLFSIILVACVVTGTGVVKDCFSTTADDYIGHQQTTENGTPCIRWDSSSGKNTYTNDDFRDATVSDAANFCRKVEKDKLWCWTSNNGHWGTCGIKKCVNDFVEKCGNLKIKQPALLGRNVTFTFTPDSYDSNAILEWQRAAEGNPWYTRPLTYKFTQYNKNGTYFMVLTDSLAADSSTTNDEVNYRIHYYNESIRCRMETGKLELDGNAISYQCHLDGTNNPNNPCGFVYQRMKRVREGGNIYLEYYPSKNANPVNFTLELAHSDNGYALFKKFEGDIYKTDKTENGMILLTIPMANISMNGYYKVKCGGNAVFTNTVSVTVLVRPSAPEFTNLQDIDECKECIVGSVIENIKVHCKTSGGTPPVNVTLRVGDKQVNSNMTRITFDNRYHNTTVTCAVMNSALTSPLITTAKVYVIQSPVKVVLSTPRYLKQGSPVNITCQSQNSRPSPIVYLTISGINVSSADTMPTFNKGTLLYNNTATLTTFKREWNGKDIACCTFNKWFNTPTNCCKPKKVNLLFPPSDIKLEIKFDSVDPLHMYALCTLNNSNPVCRANFTAASRIIGSEKNSSNTSLPHGAWKTKYFVHLNVNKKDDGKDVTCAAVCADFQNLDLRDTKTIKVPYRPVIKFNISGPMLSITKGEKAHIKCVAESYPASNISWIEKTDKKDKVKKQCDNEQECVLDVNADAISELYFVCAIRYLQFQDDKTLIVNIHEPDSVDFINMILIAGICSALLVIVVIVVLIIRDKRNNDQAKHDTVLERNSLHLRENEYIETINDVADADDQLEVTYSQPIKKQKVATVCDDTYAEVDKTRNKEQTATCSATESQRTEDGQLMYVDMEFNADRKTPKEAVVKRRDSPTEYVGIDFAKTAAYIAEENETTEMDSIYVNQ